MERSNLKRLISGFKLQRLLPLAFLLSAVAWPANLHLPGVVNIQTSASIGVTADPNAKAVLDVVSTTKGVLLPRMTTTQQNAISSPPEGLWIYDNVLHMPAVYNGSGWLDVFSASNLSAGTLPAARLPNPSASTLGGVESLASTTHQWINTISTSGVPSSTQPAFSDVSGSVTAAQLPNPTASTLGGVESLAAVSHNFLTSISTSGVPTQAQPAFTDISGSVAAAQLPNPSASTLGGVESLAAVSHKFLTSISTSGVPTQAQPVCGDLSDAAASCNTDATNASNISSGTLAVARGGTGLSSGTSGGVPYYSGSGTIASSAALTSHAIMIGGGTGATPYTLASNGSSTQCLISAGASADPGWGACTGARTPTQQKFLSTGSQTGWAITVSSANATVGATYTNNSNTYTVQGTISAGTLLFVSGTGATSGTTLTKATGTGDATITFSTKVASATYTTAGTYLRVKMAAGGGSGGAGDGGGAGNAGTPSYFGANLLVANGGAGGGNAGANGGAGGTASIAAGASGLPISGGSGSGGSISGGQNVAGGAGGVTCFGGGGGGGGGTNAGLAGAANTGAGGGGGSSVAINASSAGAGGGAGACTDEVLITSPAATMPYVIGTGGAAVGTGSRIGQAGGTGALVITEY